ncbi:hypothetical protein BABINDRAFT_24787, partial [Babjeviella inositovora NRRL Y-12698]
EDEDDGGLFGDDDDEPVVRGLQSDDELVRGLQSDHSDDERPFGQSQVPDREQREIDIDVPFFGTNSKMSSSHYELKLPSFLLMELKPFDPAEFRSTIDEDADRETQLADKLLAENTIRWRYSKGADDNQISKQSNTQVIEWSDGSLSLQIGQEIFDLPERKLHDQFLAVAREAQEILQTEAVLDKLLTVVPTSSDSLTHKRLTNAIRNKQKRQQVSTNNVIVQEDPELAAREFEKAENEKWRSQRRLEAKRRLDAERLGRTSTPVAADRGAVYSSNSFGAAGSGEYDEEDGFVIGDDEDEEDFDDLDDEEGEEEEEEAEERLRSVKAQGRAKYRSDDEEDHRKAKRSSDAEEDQ